MMAVKLDRKESKEDIKTGDNLDDNTIRIARLKLLMIAAKITSHSNVTEVKYSEHDNRVSGLFEFYRRLDRYRERERPWNKKGIWVCKHLAAMGMEQALNPS